MTIAQDGFKLKVVGGLFADSEIIVLLGQHGTEKTTSIACSHYLIHEPSAHLTPQQRDVAARVIRRFVTLFNKTAFVVEHDFTMVEHLADKVVVFVGTPSVDCVAKAPQLWTLFLARRPSVQELSSRKQIGMQTSA
ncbi:Translation initiation factor RLI1 [Artemisia annua]|uniref:Translation initiation factor RLI1 n=1 Tax=Artemisia annua TaxID=35608 RepID=A0A2U1QMX8_ARTAN|nr:Translation initiation factor RLI1 [Artemisia annua]